MAGNVQEWIADRYSAYSSERQVDPEGPSSGDYGVMRGGSLFDGKMAMRSSYRSTWDPLRGNITFGFRCARDAG